MFIFISKLLIFKVEETHKYLLSDTPTSKDTSYNTIDNIVKRKHKLLRLGTLSRIRERVENKKQS